MGRTRIIIVLVVAALGAVILMALVGAMTKHKPAPVQVASGAPAQPMARVLVAKHDLSVGTRLGPNDLAWQDWPADALNPAFVTDGQGARVRPASTTAALAAQANQTVQAAASIVAGGDSRMQQMYGSIVRQSILANEPVTNAKVVRGGEGGYMAVVLQPGMRAVALPVNVGTGAGGFILPGDRVDLLQSHSVSTSGGPSTIVAQVLLRNIRVLAIDQNSLAPKNGVQSQVGATATLEVAAADAEVIARAKAQGEVILALRPYSDTAGPSGRDANDSGDQGQVRIFRADQPAEVVSIQ